MKQLRNEYVPFIFIMMLLLMLVWCGLPIVAAEEVQIRPSIEEHKPPEASFGEGSVTQDESPQVQKVEQDDTLPEFYGAGLRSEPTRIEVGTLQKMVDAVAEVNGGAPGAEFIIELTADIDARSVAESWLKLASHTTTTIIGQGHTLKNFYGFDLSGGAVLNLGSSEDLSELIFDFEHVPFSPTPRPVFVLQNSSQLNMYEGVTVKNYKISYTSAYGAIAYVETGASFNMYGGSIRDNHVADSGVGPLWQPMIMVLGSFTMTGGEITNNTVKRLTQEAIGFTPADYVPGGAIAVYGGTLQIQDGKITHNKIETIGGRGYGAAIYASEGATVAIDNAVITDNTIDGSFGYGGGICADTSNVTVTNSLVAFNSASHSASDVYFNTEGRHTLSLPTAAEMNAKLPVGSKQFTCWYKDEHNNRFSEENITEQVDNVENVSGFYALVAGSAPETISIDVAKNWVDNNNQGSMRPDSVSISLWADGLDTGKKLLLTGDRNWRGTFSELVKYKGSVAIAYTISEVPVDNYSSVISGNAAAGFIITNTCKSEPSTATSEPAESVPTQSATRSVEQVDPEAKAMVIVSKADTTYEAIETKAQATPVVSHPIKSALSLPNTGDNSKNARWLGLILIVIGDLLSISRKK